jgi:uncharacterized protein (AIM24 family)
MAASLGREAFERAMIRGNELLRESNLAEAQRAFLAALQHDPDNVRALALLGLTYFRANQFSDARPIYEELCSRLPNDASHYLNLGLVRLKLGDTDGAIEALETSRRVDPSQGRAVNYLGLAYARAGRYADAYEAFLIAGQSDLAAEIEPNLTVEERRAVRARIGEISFDDDLGELGEASQEDAGSPAAAAPSAPGGEVQRPLARSPSRAFVAPNPPFSSSPLAPPRRETAELPRPRTPSSAPPPGPIVVTSSAASSAASSSASSASSAASAAASPAPAAPTATTTSASSPSAAVPRPAAAGAITRAVAIASPAAAGRDAARASTGNRPPMPLSELATHALVRPDDGDHTFEVSETGALLVRVTDRVLCRMSGVYATGGQLDFEPAHRRSRGASIDELFDHGGDPLSVVTGAGYLVAFPDRGRFTAVYLDDDILYLREEKVFAFSNTLRWENGNIPGLRGKVPVVQFRGDGAVAFRTARTVTPVKLPAAGTMFVDATALVGWIGRVVPRAVLPAAGGPIAGVCVECTGEGVVLVEAAEPAPSWAQAAGAPGASGASAAGSGEGAAGSASRAARGEAT